jgi:hypothetical protein
MKRPLPINSAARNYVWSYPHTVPSRFAHARAVVETTRSHEMPDVRALPGSAYVSVEFYGGACSIWLDGDRHRVYTRRFEYASFASEEEARHAFLTLWREVEGLESPAEVERAGEEWLERRR